MRWKLILGVVTGVIVLLVVAVYFIVSSYNFNDLKPRISRAAMEATGRELKLAGNLGLKIGLNPSLVAEDVSFQNASWGSRPELATVKKLEMQVALVPLISGKIEFQRFVLIEPDILVETDKTGKLNLVFETAKEPPPPKAETGGAAPGITLPSLTFSEVRIEKGRLIFKDGETAKTYSLALEKLAASYPSAESPVKLELKGAFNDKAFEVSGTVGSLLALTDPHGTWPLKIACKAANATLSLEGEIKDVMSDRSLAINIDARGPSVSDVAGLAEIAGVPAIGPFKIAGKVVGQGVSPAVENLDVDLGTEDQARLKLTGSIKEPMAQRGVDITFDLQGKEADKAARLASLSIPATGKFHLSGHAVDSGEKAYKVSDLKIALADTDLAGTVDLNLAGKKPKVSASLSGGKLDLRPFMPKDSGKKSSEAGARHDRVFPSTPVSIEPLKIVDADFRLQTGEILTPRLALSNTTLSLALADGTLDVQSFKTNLGGGTLDAHVNVSPRGKALELRMVLKAKGLDLARVTKEFEASEKIDGHLDLDVDIEGKGASVADLMSSLNGKTILVLGNSRIHNKYIDLLGADVSATAFRLLNPLSKKTEYTEINCFVSGLDIRNGLAQTTSLVLDTDHMSVVGEGTINLKTERLDIALKPSPKEGTGLSGLGKVSINVGELAKALKLSGTLAKPSLAIDPTQSAIAFGKAAGGMALFGPAGIAASLAGGSSDQGNRCLLAIEAAKKGVKPSEKSLVEKTAESGKSAVTGAGEKVKKLFGR